MSSRLLFLAERYPPDLGGVATSAGRISRALASAGADVSSFTFEGSRGDAASACAAAIRAWIDGLGAVGAVGAFTLGIIVFGDSASIVRIVSIALIVAGIVGLKIA